MKVAFLQEHMIFWNGGVRYLYEVARRLAEDNEVTVFCGATSLANKERFYNAGVKVDTTVIKFENSIKYWVLYPFYMARNALALKFGLQKSNYGVILSTTPSTTLLTLLVRIKPIIVCMELNPWVYSESYISGLTKLKRCVVKFWSPVAKYMEKLAYKNAIKIIVWSKFVQSEVKRVYGVDSEVVYTGIDTEFFKKAGE
jgi:glycosyltransferase involved in cell wall biosynthesis